MKVVHPWTVGPLALIASGVIRTTMSTCQFYFSFDDPAADPRRSTEHGIYLFWHEMMLFPVYFCGHRGFSVLVSRNIDGELITHILKMFGYSVVRGSSTRAGLSALRGLMRQGKIKHLAITPDGPLGPRRVIQPGAVYLASRSGMPIWPLGFAFRHCWHAESWDRMAIPKPFTTGYCVTGKAISVPSDVDMDQIESYRLVVQQAMEDVQGRAESQAARYSSESYRDIFRRN